MQEWDAEKGRNVSTMAWAAVFSANAELEAAVEAAQQALDHSAEHTLEVGAP